MSSRKKRRRERSAPQKRDPFVGTQPIKDVQLSGQVHEAITYALLCSTSPVLRELRVVSVESLRGSAAMLVHVEQGEVDHAETTSALERAAGYIRAEVARTINRKRMPTIEFVIVPVADLNDS